MTFTDLLVQTAHVRRRATGGPSAQTGEWVRAAPVTVVSLPCRVSWRSGSENVGPRGDQRGQYRYARVYFDAGEFTVQRGDEVVVDDISGVTFEVVFQKLVYGSAGPHHWEVDVEVVEGV